MKRARRVNSAELFRRSFANIHRFGELRLGHTEMPDEKKFKILPVHKTICSIKIAKFSAFSIISTETASCKLHPRGNPPFR